MNLIGWNPAEQDGMGVGDGVMGRLVDPTTGAGVFNPNLDPAVVGIDPLTGSLAPTGTDMSFGAPIIRQVLAGAINGDFAAAPPSGAWPGTGDFGPYLIDSDPTSATYNPLPGCLWTPPSDGIGTALLWSTGGRNKLMLRSTAAGVTGAYAAWPIVAPVSTGQQFRAMISFYIDTVSASNATVSYQWYKPDGTTTVGSEVSRSVTFGSAAEYKVDAGLVPSTAGRLTVKVNLGSTSAAAQGLVVSEVRVTFIPSEAEVGLGSISASSSGITTTETVVKAITIPANTFVVGSVYRVTLFGTITSTVANSTTFRIRIGPTTLTGAVIVSAAPVATTTATNDGFEVSALLTVFAVGASGSVMGHMRRVGSSTQPWSTSSGVTSATAAVAIDTTVANLLELTIQTAAGTTTVTARQAVIECVMAS